MSVARVDQTGQKILPFGGRRAKPETAEPAFTPPKGTASSPWYQIANNFDVRHMTADDMEEMSQTLFENGAISFSDHALLSFQPENQPGFGDSYLGILGTRPLLTESWPDGTRDWINEYETRLDFDRQNGGGHEKTLNHILGHLERLDIIKSGPTEIWA